MGTKSSRSHPQEALPWYEICQLRKVSHEK